MLYKISWTVTVSCYTEVEAESEEEARDIADQRPPQIWTWCGDPYGEVWIVDYVDWEPTITDIDTN